MRMGSAEARKSGRETRPSRKAPLKPKNGLSEPPAEEIYFKGWTMMSCAPGMA